MRIGMEFRENGAMDEKIIAFVCLFLLGFLVGLREV